MSSNFTINVQCAIREYIESVGEVKIFYRTQDKLEFLYKELMADVYARLEPCVKSNKDLKNKVQIIKKKKPDNGSTKYQKIEFNDKLLVELIGVLVEFGVLNEMVDSYRKLIIEVKRVKNWNIYEQWVDWALAFGDGSYLATHIAKLTHSSSKGSSVDLRYFPSCSKYNELYLCTDRLKNLDSAYPDNKYSSISKLYHVNIEGHFIGDLLRDNGASFLSCLTDDQELLQSWVASFSKKIRDEDKQSYFLSKQVYFPVSKNQYHLLMPLASSSLIHELHLEHKKRWEEPLESAFDRQSKAMYSPTTVTRYPNRAYLHVTGSNHSNASSLNGKRGGRIPLMSSLPPQWESRLPSYIDKSSIFSKALAFELKEEINELANYLLMLKNKELSVNEPKRNASVLRKLREINGNLFNYLDSVNEYENSYGWTKKSNLSIEEQILFEPQRDDEEAKVCKINNDWQKKLSKEFGRWLNQQLNKKLKLTPIQAGLWADCFLVDLKERVAVKEVEL